MESAYTDPVLEEIWAIREKLAARFDYDIHELGRFYMEYQKRFADRLVPLPGKSAERTEG